MQRQACDHVDTHETPEGAKLIFELTNLCNFSCVHCIRDEEGPKRYLPVEVLERVLQEAKAYRHITHVAFTGGEPTLHPRFMEIVERVVAHGYTFGLVTNAWNFQKVLPNLLPFQEAMQGLTFSIDGTSEATHDTLRRRPGSFRRLVQAMSLCVFHRIPFHINMVVTRTNRDELEAMALFASRLGAEALGYGHCQPTPESRAAGLVLNVQERRDVEAEIATLQQTLRMPIYLAGDHYTPSTFTQCPQLRMQEFNIDYRGYLTACCTLSNYRGGAPDTDVLADLSQVSFYESHKRLIAKIAQLNQEKVERLNDPDTTAADNFLCTHCLLHFNKVPDIESVLTAAPGQCPPPQPVEELIHVDF